MLPNCYVGAVIRQGEAFYREGGKGSGVNGKFATHVHAVFARGHLTGAYWYNVGNGNYGMLSTGGKQHIYDVLFVPDDVQIVKTNDYKDSYPVAQNAAEGGTYGTCSSRVSLQQPDLFTQAAAG